MPVAKALAGNLRVIVSLCKGGSTALIHSLSHAPGVTCYLQTVKSGQRQFGIPDYSVYYCRHEGVVLSKETIGHSTVADCTLAVFPSDEAIAVTRPVFLFRDPVDAWAAWARSGWGSLACFLQAYGHLLDLYDRARSLSPDAAAIRYEAFGENVRSGFRRLCDILEIRFDEGMIRWRHRFPEESTVIWREDVQADFDRGQADSARAARGFIWRRTDFMPAKDDLREIEGRFRARYEACAAE